MISTKENRKYDRQIKLPNFGIEGQKRLKSSKILVIGAGGLGSAVLYYLTCAGVGNIGIVDPDKVDLTNLNRQILHFESDLEKSKISSAIKKLSQLNPDIKFTKYAHSLLPDNAEKIISEYDFVVEASDNFKTKFLVNDVCVKLGKPFVIGGVFQFEGQLMTVLPKETACYRCAFKDAPEKGSYPTTSEHGIMGTTAGFFGIVEANEAIKYIVFKEPEKLLLNQILYTDLLHNSFEIFTIQRDELSGLKFHSFPFQLNHKC